jgi:hypothetical protein
MIPIGDVLVAATASAHCEYSPEGTHAAYRCPARQVIEFRIGRTRHRLCRKHMLRLMDYMDKVQMRAKVQERGGA